MPATYKFPIPEAYAEQIASGIKVMLVYPPEAQRNYTTERKYSGHEAIEFGIDTLTRLYAGERVRIGTPEFPSRPASGAIIDVLYDDSFFSHRRDKGTKVHPLYNGIPSGFPSSEEHFRNIAKLQRKEGAEESILFTMDDEPWVYVPDDEEGKNVTLRRLAELGITNRTIETVVEYESSNDLLEIRDEKGKLIVGYRGNIYLSWECETNVAIASTRYWPTIDPKNVRAIDAEGMHKDGQFIHFNREAFHFYSEDVEGIPFGARLENPRVYKLNRNEIIGIPLQQTQPEKPYDFMPDDGLRRMLDAFHLDGWNGLWIPREIEEERKRLDELRRQSA